VSPLQGPSLKLELPPLQLLHVVKWKVCNTFHERIPFATGSCLALPHTPDDSTPSSAHVHTAEHVLEGHPPEDVFKQLGCKELHHNTNDTVLTKANEWTPVYCPARLFVPRCNTMFFHRAVFHFATEVRDARGLRFYRAISQREAT